MTDHNRREAELQWQEESYTSPTQHSGDASLRVSNDDELTVKLVPNNLPLADDPEGEIVKTDTTVSLSGNR